MIQPSMSHYRMVFCFCALLACCCLGLTVQSQFPTKAEVSLAQLQDQQISSSNGNSNGSSSASSANMKFQRRHERNVRPNRPLADMLQMHEGRTNDSVCDLCEQNWVFILGSGRSGSTSVLSMLNSLPDAYVIGETHGALSHLLDFYLGVFRYRGFYPRPEKDVASQDYLDPPDEVTAYSHALRSQRQTLCAIQAVAKSLMGYVDLSKYKLLGFKEIMYHSPEMLNFLTHVFPCAKFLVNVRSDMAAQAESTFWKRNQMSQLKSITRSLRQFQAEDPASRYLLELEHFSVEYFNKMLTWLGISGCTFTQVAQANSNGSKYTSAAPAPVKGACVYDSKAEDGSQPS
eukprot:TRINITY_DN36944_c0_g1_i1.p1 TRINITY_DN36944_c0_g1~~TRINITY_DN36944_c0_g1_i1.p1  ORF type:complete len:364 (-),score=46.68 TRINITY_DN36944_c0_g1_i1:182-1216(-)